MKPLLFHMDANGRETEEIQPSDHVENYVLSAGTPRTVQVPPSARYVFLNFTRTVYATYDREAFIPAQDVADGQGVEINPTRRRLKTVRSISLVSESDCVVSLAYYS